MFQRSIFMAGALAFVLAPSITRAEPSDKGTYCDLSLYFAAAGMDGKMAIHGIESDLDVSFKDMIENLDGGFMSRVTLGSGRWFVSGDAITMTLAGEKGPVKADLTQWMVQPMVGYQVMPQFALYAGARYNSIKGDVTGPLGNEHTNTVDWWDPVVGGRAHLPLSRKLALQVAADIDPFETASDLSWQAEPTLSFRFGGTVSAEAGYRWLYTEYEEGSGSEAFRYNVTTQGPEAGVTLHF